MSTTQNRQLVLKAYKEVLRAINFAFKDDSATIQNARKLASESFHKEPSVAVKPRSKNPLANSSRATIEDGIEQALSVAKILRENVVQGRADESDPTKFKLNIHEGIERGDNESIKMKTPLKGTTKQFPKCS